MRQLFPFVAVVVLAGCANSKKNEGFELTGQLSNTNNETIYLDQLASQQPQVVDSAELDSEGRFEFTNYRPTVGFYRIRQSQQNFAMLVLDSNDKVKVTGNLADLGNTYKVEGSEETRLFLEYNEIVRRRDMRLDSINSLAQMAMEPHQMDKRKMDSLAATFEGPFNRIHQETNEVLVKKIMDNTDKFASIMAVQSLEPDKHPEVYKALAEGLIKKFPAQPTVKMFSDYVKSMLQTAAGQQAPDISLPSPDGRQLSLSDYRGKVVLVDFWASWCGPCRREMPNVVKAYNKYKDRGFEIFGVSLDQDKNKWVEAIASDQMTWPQVSDLQGWQSSAARLYNVQAIPYTVLVDREGIILAKNLRGPELESRLDQALGVNDSKP